MRVLRCAAESIDGVGAGYWRARAWSSSVGAGGSDPMRFPSLEPERMSPAQKRVHDFCTALHRRQAVDDDLFGQAVALLGEQGVVDLVGVSGYYALVSLVLNDADCPRTAGAQSE